MQKKKKFNFSRFHCVFHCLFVILFLLSISFNLCVHFLYHSANIYFNFNCSLTTFVSHIQHNTDRKKILSYCFYFLFQIFSNKDQPNSCLKRTNKHKSHELEGMVTRYTKKKKQSVSNKQTNKVRDGNNDEPKQNNSRENVFSRKTIDKV